MNNTHKKHLKKIKWGIIGGGILANDFIAPAIKLSNNSELIAVYCRNKNKAKEFASRHSVPFAYYDLDDFLTNTETDVVYIASPNSLHQDHIIKASFAKKHIFCEKPLSNTIKDTKKIKEACNINKTVFGIGFMFPFHPLNKIIKKWVNESKVGKIKLVRANFIFSLPSVELENPWRFQPKISGGGAIIEVGCHCINVLDHIIEKKITQVHAIIDRQRMEAPSENLGIISCKYENGILGSITVSNNLQGAGPYGMNIEIHGSNGSIIGIGNLSRYPDGKIIFRDLRGEETQITLPTSKNYDLYIEEIENFSDSLIYKNKPFFSLEDGLYNLKVVEAIYCSSQTGRTEIVDYGVTE